MNKGVELIWSEFRQNVLSAIALFTSPTSLFMLVTGCVVAVVAGPFGTLQTMPVPVRLAYWGAVIFSGVAIGALCRAILLTTCRHWRPLPLDLKISLATATLLAPLIYGLRGALDPVLSWSDLLPVTIWLNTLVFVAPITLLQRKLGPEPVPDEGAPPRPRLARRLPETLQEAEILRLSGNGHNVEVVTDRGTETLRLRLSDAIDEMEPVAGICTHRSHWVALAAIAGRVRAQGKSYVLLRNGERIPVTRKYADGLDAAGMPEGPVEEA
jgi:hypothetical protein